MTNVVSITQALATARAKLIAIDSAALDAEILLAYVLQVARSYLWAHPEQSVLTEQLQAYLTLIEARSSSRPVAYLTGECEFWSLPLQITDDVLVPRPETEHLIEQVCATFSQEQSFTCLELGTGSGAISLAIAHERQYSQIVALDISDAALAVAKQNASHLGLMQIEFVQSDWYQQCPDRRFNLIVSNPPYLAHDDPYLATSIRHEPRGALVSGITGLEAYECIISQAPAYLQPGGMILLEHGEGQAESIGNLLIRNNFTRMQSYPDLQGIARVLSAEMV